MNNRALNITNGDAFNRYFISKFGGEALPFREAMMEGNTVSNIFTDDFIDIRSKELNISAEKYRANMLICGALNNNEYLELDLWFGKDTFCQMNLLTLLAYLEQIEYCGRVILNYIDDETFDTVEENIVVELGIYKKLYEDILIFKQVPSKVGVLAVEAIDLYFDYCSENGVLANLVRENSNMEYGELICLLLADSKEYGLSDIQAEKLIKKHRIRSVEL